MSTRVRLLLLVLAVWLPAAAGVGLLARATYLKEEAAALRSLQDLAQRVNASIGAVLDQQFTLAQALANSEALRARDLGRFEREAAAATVPKERWVVLIEKDRQVYNSLFPSARGTARAPESPFLESGGRQVAFAQRGPVTGAPVVGTFVPERTQPVRYNVVVATATEAMQSVVEAQDYPLASIVSVINDNHLIMARSRDPGKWVGTSASTTMIERIRADDTGFTRSVTLDGSAVISHVSAPNAYGWRTVVSLPSEALAAAARSLTLQALGLTTLLLTFGLFVALSFARPISDSVLALRAWARELARNRPVPAMGLPLAEANEVGQVLRESSAQVRQFNAALETRVQEAVAKARQSQAQLVESQKREAIGRLTSGLAHDFNNLLQTISMGVELAMRTAGPGPHERALQSSRDAALRAADLVRQIQTFGRSVGTDPQPVDLADFVLRSTSIIRNALGRGIELDIALEPGLPAALADPAQLELAVLNLIFNARDALPDGGRAVLVGRRATPEDLQALPAGDYVAVEVVDNGVGIRADALARVLEPYFTTKPVGVGTGLGLAQVHAFALQSNGDVRIHSIEGEGTRVTVLLPVATVRPESQRPAAAVVDGPLTPLRILVVEDDPLVASVVAPVLEGDGHALELLSSADAALERLAAGADYDVLFTDVVMPGTLNGLDLARWVHEHRPGIGVLVATGYTPHDPGKGAPVLRKPYRIAELRQALVTVARARA
ncbi:ATP-binding protein [Ramlibacter rhizophilus]|nr:ATP-binding protein [Ramlibacter rhizophilus]